MQNAELYTLSHLSALLKNTDMQEEFQTKHYVATIVIVVFLGEMGLAVAGGMFYLDYLMGYTMYNLMPLDGLCNQAS